MNLEQFEQRALAYGADVDRWPQADQAAARMLLQADAEARAMLADIAGLDELVHRATKTQSTGAAFTGRILSALHTSLESDRPMLTAGWRWAFSVSAVIALALGFFTGLNGEGMTLLGPESASALTLIADQAGDEVLL